MPSRTLIPNLDQFDPNLIESAPGFWESGFVAINNENIKGAVLLETENYREFLADELARRMRTNPRYSQRAFSRHLGLSPGELSEVLNGKRRLGIRSVLRISQALGLNQTETKHLALLVQMEKTQELGKGELLKSGKEIVKTLPETRALSHDLFAIVADWYHFAILNLAETEGFEWKDHHIARRLGISRTEAVLAIKRLQKVGLITKNKSGDYNVTRDYVKAVEEVPSEAGRRFHQQILQKATSALDLQSISERDISGISFPIHMKNIPSIKKDISEFFDQIAAKYSKDRIKNEVYHLEISLFRLSEGEPGAKT